MDASPVARASLPAELLRHIFLDASPVALASLPAELILHIFSYLHPIHLAPISLTCRRLNILATPLVYRAHIADPNIFHPLPISTKLPARHAELVTHLALWGQHPTDGEAAFQRCPNISTISWDLGPDITDVSSFSTAHLPPGMLPRIASLRIELVTHFRGFMHLDNTSPFRWLDCFAACTNLTSLTLCPRAYELPPTTEFVPWGGPVAREQELLDTVDDLFGATLVRLALEWCPPARSTAPNFLLDSRLCSTTGFPALRTLELPFSSQLVSYGSLLHAYRSARLPTRGILHHAFRVSRERPQLVVRNLQLSRDQPREFAPLLADFHGLNAEACLEFFDWICEMFPGWSRELLRPDMGTHKQELENMAVIDHLVSAGVRFGLRYYVGRGRLRRKWTPEWGKNVKAMGEGLRSVALEMPAREAATGDDEAVRNAMEAKAWRLWLKLLVGRGLRVARLEMLSPRVEAAAGGLRMMVEEDMAAVALMTMVVQAVEDLGVQWLALELPVLTASGLWGLSACTGLVGLKLMDVVVDGEAGLEVLYRVLGRLGREGRLREFGFQGWVGIGGVGGIGRSRRAEVEGRVRREIGDRILELLSPCAGCSVVLELRFVC